MLEIKNLTFSYDAERYLYDDAEIKLLKNGLYFLDSRNGTGKSTLFKLIKGIIKSDIEINVDGIKNDFTKISYIDYKLLVLNRLRVYEYLSLFSNDKEYVNSLLEEFKLSHVKNSMPRSLSDGEKTRLAFVSGILEGNNVILIDEIFSHLDKKSTDIIMDAIERLSKDKIIIITSHKESFRIRYDYLIKIKDKKLILEENEKTFERDSFPLKENSLNFKMLKKSLEFKPRYLFAFLIVILSTVLSYFITVLNYKPERIEYMAMKNSNAIPYVVTEDYNSRLDGYEHDNLNLGLDSDIKMYTTNKTRMPIIDLADIDTPTFYDELFKVERVFTSNSYKGKPLNEDEIVITDYLYNSLLASKNFEKSFKVDGNDIYLSFNGFKAHVVDVVDTGFNKEQELEFSKLGVSAKPNSFRANYFYYSIYMNQKTFDKILNNACQKIKDGAFIDNMNLVELKTSSADLLLDGRLPEATNEILIPYNIANYNIGDEYILYLNCGSKNDLYSNESSYGFFGNSRTLRKVYKIVGYTNLNTYCLYNDEALDSLYKSYLDYYEADAIDINNFSYDDYMKIHNLGYRMMMDNIKLSDEASIKLINGRILNNVMIYVIATLIIASSVLYLFMEKHYLYNDIFNLKNKNIDNKLIKKYLITFNLKSATLLIVLSSLVIGGVVGFNLFEPIILRSLGF